MDVDLNSLPNWQEVLGAVGSLPIAARGSKIATYDGLSEEKPLFKMAADHFTESTSMRFVACQSLLSLLCWLPKGYMNSRSFSLHATYLLNLER